MNRTLKSVLTLNRLWRGRARAFRPARAEDRHGRHGQRSTTTTTRPRSRWPSSGTTSSKAQEELERMVKEGNQLVEQYKETAEQSKNTLLTPRRAQRPRATPQKMLEEHPAPADRLQNFRANTQRSLQQRFNNFRSAPAGRDQQEGDRDGQAQGRHAGRGQVRPVAARRSGGDLFRRRPTTSPTRSWPKSTRTVRRRPPPPLPAAAGARRPRPRQRPTGTQPSPCPDSPRRSDLAGAGRRPTREFPAQPRP